jgi:membrane fusion protein (multidrug efflux system)
MPDTIETKPIETQEEFTSERPRPRSRLKWIAVIVVIVVAVVAVPLYRYYSIRESTDDAQVDGHIHPIGPKVGGIVTSVAVDDNQYVEAGTVLLQLDPHDYQNTLARAQADVAEQEALWRASQADIPVTSETAAGRLSGTQAAVQEAQASLLAAQKEVQAAEARLVAAEARLRETTANSQRAAKDLERMSQLIAKEEISQQQFDTAAATAASLRASEEAARAAVGDAEASLQAAQSRVVLQQARLAQAHADVQEARTAPEQVAAMRARADSARAKWEHAKAAADQATLDLSYTTVQAPVSGIVSKRSVEVGQRVVANQPLLAIVALDDIWITANFKETQLRDMRPGQKAIVSVDAYGGRKYEGLVDSIAAATGAKFSLLPPENATGNYVKVVQRIPVKIVLEKGQDPEHLLRPGMSVVPTVMTR